MSDHVILQNTTDRRLTVIFKGEQHFLEPRGRAGQQLPVDRETAEFIKKNLGGSVTELSEQEMSDYVEPVRDENVVLANMTGDPDAPLEFVTGRYKNKVTGKFEDEIMKNENHGAQILEEYLGAKHVFYETAGGAVEVEENGMTFGFGRVTQAGEVAANNARTVLGRNIRIMPFQRVRVPGPIGREFLKRDLERPRLLQGKVIKARPPQAFEPKKDWPEEQKRAWLQLTDSQFRKNPASLGPTADEIKSDPANAKLDEKAIEALIAEQDHKIWARCFLRMVNPSVAIPTEQDFAIFTRTQAATAKRLSKKAAE